MDLCVGGGEKLVHFGGSRWTGEVVTLCRVVATLRKRAFGVSVSSFSMLDVPLLWGRVHGTTGL